MIEWLALEGGDLLLLVYINRARIDLLITDTWDLDITAK